jgi:glycolate oxidase iron-sulfur subunit
VRFGEMMEIARDAAGRTVKRPLAERIARAIGFRALLPSRFALRRAIDALGFAQRTGLFARVAARLGERGRAALAMPRVPPRAERAQLPARTPAIGEQRGEVAVLEGCVMPELYGRVNRATVDTLARMGFACRTAFGHGCCGALHAHNGDLAGARSLAKATIDAFRRAGGLRRRAAAGRGQQRRLWRAHARVRASVRTGSDLERARRALLRARRRLQPLRRAQRSGGVAPGRRGPTSPASASPGTIRATCATASRSAASRASSSTVLHGLQRVELENSESCCGSAGIYSVLRPADSAAVFAGKLAAFDKSGATVLVTANPGCQMQWESGFARAGRSARVLHLAEVLAASSR